MGGVSLSGFLWPDQDANIKATDPPYIDFHGTADPTVPIMAANETKAAMDKAGALNFLVPFPGDKHVPFPTLYNHTSDVMGFLTTYMDLVAAECPRAESKVLLV